MESTEPAVASTARRELEPRLESIGRARDFVAEVLAEPEVEPPIDRTLLADIQLVVSELVTNAVTHGSGPTVVRVALTPLCVNASVTSVRSDEPPVQPVAEVPSGLSRSGRGLAIVDALADSVVATSADSTWTVDCAFERR